MKKIEDWFENEEWFDRWSKRIKKQLSIYVGVVESDFYETGMTEKRIDQVEVVFALHQYFRKYEFEEDLVLTRRGELSFYHPRWSGSSKKDEWVLLPQENLDIRRST